MSERELTVGEVDAAIRAALRRSTDAPYREDEMIAAALLQSLALLRMSLTGSAPPAAQWPTQPGEGWR